MQLHALNQDELDPQIRNFYCRSLDVLLESKIPFLIGGAYAFERYTGIARHTKDLDLFARPKDCPRILEVLSAKNGCSTEISAPHWLAKAFCGENFIDIIFNSANALSEVDDLWFEHSVREEVLGISVQICPPEEIILTKAFIMARDRYDGADIAHLIHACSETLNWPHLLHRFDQHWRVLFSHLILFGFIYPGERERIPSWVMEELSQRLQQEMNSSPSTEKVCQGTVLSPLQYQVDLEEWGYQDVRLRTGNMTAKEIFKWNNHLTNGELE
ncbi:MAG: nucleotidyltransferase [Cyanobacteriota bacterium]